ncbi:Uncharacterised protein [Escherichia coli]|uniref:Uncharacterized protein n=1 Tax=Escherichia coli TaxID=562 RepID=A0A376WAV3_ECOLX|nr:Uncharacterised protein [Escherichia coli]
MKLLGKWGLTVIVIMASALLIADTGMRHAQEVDALRLWFHETRSDGWAGGFVFTAGWYGDAGNLACTGIPGRVPSAFCADLYGQCAVFPAVRIRDFFRRGGLSSDDQ